MNFLATRSSAAATTVLRSLARRTGGGLRAAAPTTHQRAAAAYTTHSQLPEEHRMVYEMCRKFADEELAPHAGEWDRKHEFPQQAVAQLVRRIDDPLKDCDQRL